MNYKLEKFWNNSFLFISAQNKIMNYKLEKFWNSLAKFRHCQLSFMNYKLEKFWNIFIACSKLFKFIDEL